jgi:drug/metabolite transporter (DMT)-like permease
MALLVGMRVRVRLRRIDWARLATIGLVGGAIPFLLFFRGLQMAGSAGAATATFGYRTLFLMATVLAVVFLKERVSVGTLLATVLLLAGNALLLSLSAPVWTDGTLFVLAATALWAGEYALSKRTLRDLPSSTVALGRMGFGGVFLAAYLALSGQLSAVGGLSGSQWTWVVLSAILLVGFVSTWYAGLKTVDLSVATAVLVLAFPITWSLGVLAGTSPVGIGQAAGVVAVVYGVAIAISTVLMKDTWDAIAAAVRVRLRSAAQR